MKRLALFLLAMMGCLPLPAKSEILGTDLYKWCFEARSGSREQDVCMAFILGVLKGIDYGAMSRTKKPCFGSYVPPEQAEIIVKKYMNDHPELLGYDAGAAVSAFASCGARTALPRAKVLLQST